MGRDLAPRVAARLGVSALADATGIALEGEALVVTRPVYSGKALATVDTAGKRPQIVSLRPNVFAAEPVGGTAEVVALDGLALSIRAVVKELLETGGGELDVAEADIIVSGGRGMQGPGELRPDPTSWRMPSAGRWAPRARWSTPAGSSTSTRSGRPARR